MKKVLLILLTTLISQYSFSKEYIFCNSCTNEIEFINFAKGRFGTSGLPTTYQVINYSTEEIWDVYVEMDYEPDPYYTFINAIASIPPQQDIDDFKEIKEIIVKKDVLVIIPPDEAPSYRGRIDDLIIHQQIAQHPVMPTLVSGLGIMLALKKALGLGKIFAIVVFPNGDVAKYEITNPSGGRLCCEYVEGSARDINGDIIASDGSNGGSGGTGDYVQPGADGESITIIGGGASTPRFFCWKIEGGVKCRRV